jgi:hypothetical protein
MAGASSEIPWRENGENHPEEIEDFIRGTLSGFSV